MSDLRHGDIYYVEFDPSIGHEFQKTRPAVVITSDELLKSSSVVSVVPFTSNQENLFRKTDMMIQKSVENKLVRDSVLKTQCVMTFDKTRMKKYIGRLEQVHLKALKQMISKNFSL